MADQKAEGCQQGPYSRRGSRDTERLAEGDIIERLEKDFDLVVWGGARVYVIGENEWFDPHTSTNYYNNGISRHAMRGPSLILLTEDGPGRRTEEFHVNDSDVWRRIRQWYSSTAHARISQGDIAETKKFLQQLPEDEPEPKPTDEG